MDIISDFLDLSQCGEGAPGRGAGCAADPLGVDCGSGAAGAGLADAVADVAAVPRADDRSGGG